MDPNDIVLEDLSKSFEFMKACMEIDEIDDLDDLRNISKAYMKLYLKQQEVLSTMLGKKKE